MTHEIAFENIHRDRMQLETRFEVREKDLDRSILFADHAVEKKGDMELH